MIVEYLVKQFLKPDLSKAFLFQVAFFFFLAKKDILLVDSTTPEPVVLNLLCIIFVCLFGLFGYYYQIVLPEFLCGGRGDRAWADNSREESSVFG